MDVFLNKFIERFSQRSRPYLFTSLYPCIAFWQVHNNLTIFNFFSNSLAKKKASAFLAPSSCPIVWGGVTKLYCSALGKDISQRFFAWLQCL